MTSMEFKKSGFIKIDTFNNLFQIQWIEKRKYKTMQYRGRFYDGTFFRIYYENNKYLLTLDENPIRLLFNYSYNMLDLLKEGDYANGYPIIEIDLENNEVCIDKIDDATECLTYIEQDLIESVYIKEDLDSISFIPNWENYVYEE